MNILLFDGPERAQMLPFTYLRPVAHLRVGIDRLIDKWDAFLGESCGVFAHAYLQKKFPFKQEKENLLINPTFLPSKEIATKIKELSLNQALTVEGTILACMTKSVTAPLSIANFDCTEVETPVLQLKTNVDLFLHNDVILSADFERITAGRKSATISDSNQLIDSDNIFIEEGAVVECAILNASKGPIYIGKNTEVMEGSMLRGSIAICENSVVKMGAKIYGGTTIGPYSKVGGELNNVVLFGYSNKGHDGFLGNAVIGEWCNIGAATDASNLKNNYGKLRLWNYRTENFAKTELQFCGLLMGDFSRCSIHTTFNTATVVGICANIFGTGFPRSFLPSFSYGGPQGLKTYAFEKALEGNASMMERRGIELTQNDHSLLEHIFNETAQWRKD